MGLVGTVLVLLSLLPYTFAIKSNDSIPLVNTDLFQAFQGSNRDSLLTETKDTAIAYLMVERDATLFHWLSQLKSENLTVFIFVDRPETNHIYRNRQGIFIVSMASSFCRSHGYSEFGSFAYIKKQVTSWDKALFFFNKVIPKYRFVWILEADVFIPSLQAFRQVHRHVVHPNATISTDLVISSIIHENNDLNAWHWRALQPLLVSQPWYHSMACVLGMSRALLQLLDDFATAHHRLQFLEVIPLTLAIQNNLTVYVPAEFETIAHQQYFSCEDVLHRSNHWFHPIKRPADFIGQCLESGEWPLEMLKNRGHYE